MAAACQLGSRIESQKISSALHTRSRAAKKEDSNQTGDQPKSVLLFRQSVSNVTLAAMCSQRCRWLSAAVLTEGKARLSSPLHAKVEHLARILHASLHVVALLILQGGCNRLRRLA